MAPRARAQGGLQDCREHQKSGIQRWRRELEHNMAPRWLKRSQCSSAGSTTASGTKTNRRCHVVPDLPLPP
eukprot:2011124-Pyramimonas_sp.AAC.1